MKNKWMISTVLVSLMASSVSAATPFDSDDAAEPPAMGSRMERLKRNHDGDRRRPELSDQQKAQMKEFRAQITALAEAARNEVDPAKKEELVRQLREKLVEGADKMQAQFEKRLEMAEKGVEKMKERLAKAEQEKSEKVEEHLQKLLAGEKPDRQGFGDRPRPNKRKSAE